MSQNPLFYVNVLARDLIALAGFYQSLFDLKEITASRSEYFRGFETGGCRFGISSSGAYELLSLVQPDRQTDTIFTSFGASTREDVDGKCQLAVDLGGTIEKAPYETYYGWYQAVLRDPEGNPFRINHMP